MDFTRFGRPRLGFLVNSGNIDSMVAHYTVAKKRRHDDAYSPGNRAGLRPDRAVIVYANKVREAFGDIPLVSRTPSRGRPSAVKELALRQSGWARIATR